MCVHTAVYKWLDKSMSVCMLGYMCSCVYVCVAAVVVSSEQKCPRFLLRINKNIFYRSPKPLREHHPSWGRKVGGQGRKEGGRGQGS